MIKKISNYTYVLLGPFNLQRANMLSKSGQLKVMITHDAIKKGISWYGRLSNYPEPWNSSLQLQKS